MTKLFDDDYAPTIAQALRITLLQMTPHEALGAVYRQLGEVKDALEAASSARQKLQDRVVAQTAVITYLDKKLDRSIIECARKKRAAIPGAKPDQSPSFRELFIHSPSEAMAGVPGAPQDQYVAIVLRGLELAENAALKAEFGERIASQQRDVTAALEQRTALEAELAQADAALERVSARARKAYNEAQIDVASLSRDEDLVASLFSFRASRPKKEKSSPPTAPS